MSDLDLSASAPAPTLTTAAPATAGALVLAPPAAVVVVQPEQAAGAVPVDDAQMSSAPLRSCLWPLISDPRSLSQPEGRPDHYDGRSGDALAASMFNWHARPSSAAVGMGGGVDATTGLRTLTDLRRVVTELDSNRATLSGAKKVPAWLLAATTHRYPTNCLRRCPGLD